MMGKQRRMFIDIETAPCFGWFWWTGKQYIGPEQILEHMKIICICFSYEDSERVYSISWDPKTQDDGPMLEKFVEIVEHNAIELIGHNSDNYDIRFINTRLAYHNLPSLPIVSTEDTIKQCKSKLRLPSYKLDFICKYFNIGGKVSTGGYKLWLDIVLRKDKEALNKMITYCANDIVILKKLDQRLQPYLAHRRCPIRVLRGKPEKCDLCGCKEIGPRGYYKSYGQEKRRGKCENPACGKWHKWIEKPDKR